MKRKFLCGAFMATMVLGCTTTMYGYDIKGKVASTVADANGKYIYILPYSAKSISEAIDSAKISNNTFALSGADKGDMMCRLIIKDSSNKKYAPSFLLEKGNMEAVIDEFSYVKGTPENDAYAEVMKNLSVAEGKIIEMLPALRNKDEEAQKKYEQIEKDANMVSLNYIKNNPTKLTAAKLLYDMRYDLSEKEQENILAKSDAKFQSFPGIAVMKEHLEVLRKVAPGKKFIDFEMADADGKTHKISEYIGKGKAVLLDFWASWCGPCMREVPNIKKLYDEYKSKGFEIIGISFDNKKANWMKARTDKNMNWIHLSDLQGWKSLAAPLYGVNSIPCTFLIDKDGTIIQRNILGEELGTKLAEILK